MVPVLGGAVPLHDHQATLREKVSGARAFLLFNVGLVNQFVVVSTSAISQATRTIQHAGDGFSAPRSLLIRLGAPKRRQGSCVLNRKAAGGIRVASLASSPFSLF